MTTIAQLIPPSGNFPNNAVFPVVIHRQAFAISEDLADRIERTFHEHGWRNSWRNGIYNCHHYHSQGHEALGVSAGWVKVQLGGDRGPEFRLEAGDVAILPAGMAHRRVEASSDYQVVGAYPPGQFPDLNYGRPQELESTLPAITAMPRPDTDPVFGAGGLLAFWA